MDMLATVEALPSVVDDNAWELPVDLTVQEWISIGRRLGEAERNTQWWIGEWWMYGDIAFGGAKAIVTAPDWDGPAYKTCLAAASCCRVFTKSRRRAGLSFTHHLETVSLPAAEADAVLDAAEHQVQETGIPPASRAIRTEVKKRRRATREAELAEATIEALQALAVPAAKDCVLFLWATAPMMPQALDVMKAWGFAYKSHCVWTKEGKQGTGYWYRNVHELLLVGTRGTVPAPAPGQQYPSAITAPPGRHSAKPAVFAEMINDMFPTVPGAELFARAKRTGWAVWGNEVAP